MKPGYRSALLRDTLTTRQFYVERFKSWIQTEFDTVSRVTWVAFTTAMAQHEVADAKTATQAQRRRVLTTCLAMFDVAAEEYRNRVSGHLRQFLFDERNFYTSALETAAVPDLSVPGEATLWKKYWGSVLIPAGDSVGRAVGVMLADCRQRYSSALTQAFALGYTTSDVVQFLRGTANVLYKNGLGARLAHRARLTVDTAIQHASSFARTEIASWNQEVFAGVGTVSTMDGKTSAQCRSLDQVQQEFGAPIGPLHYLCRSFVEPLFLHQYDMHGTPVSGQETYYSWLEKQPAAFQDEVLGAKMGSLFRDAGLTPDEFAIIVLNRRYQPLTADQLRELT